MNGFKNNYPFKQRKIDCSQILLKYPNRIPIICGKRTEVAFIKFNTSKFKFL